MQKAQIEFAFIVGVLLRASLDAQMLLAQCALKK